MKDCLEDKWEGKDASRRQQDMLGDHASNPGGPWGQRGSNGQNPQDLVTEQMCVCACTRNQHWSLTLTSGC